MVNEKKKELNEITKELRIKLEHAFAKEGLEYDIVHPSYNYLNTRNDDEILFITCYVEKNKPYGIHIDNRLETNKWVIDIVIMKPELSSSVILKLEKNGYTVKNYSGECHGEFAGHRKLMELDRNAKLDEIVNINVELLRIFQ